MNIREFIKQQKYLLGLGGVTTVFLIGIVVMSISARSSVQKGGMSQSTQPTGIIRHESAAGQTSEKTQGQPASGVRDFFAFFSKPQSRSESSGQSSPVANGSSPQSESTTEGSTFSGVRSSWGNTPVTGNGSGTTGSSSTTQKTSQTSSATQSQSGSSQSQTTTGAKATSTPTAPTSTPVPPNIQIVFENPDGSTTSYKPPGTPPTEVKWGRYVSYQDHYAIDYPVNWQIDVGIVDGHEGITLYAPGANKNDPETPYIGFGWSESYLVAASGSLTNAYDTSLLISGIPGTLYTDGPLGSSFIASIFPYQNGYFGLGTNVSDATFAYVYYYMLHSLEFGVY